MKLSDFKKHLSVANAVNFELPNGELIPLHFHITEVGLLTKHFIDCGGDIHADKLVSMQIWVADDLDHRLKPISLLKIIDLSKPVLGDEDLEIEVEYQNETIGKYSLGISGDHFSLIAKQTDCLAKVKCNIPQPKQIIKLNQLVNSENSCTPGGGCC
ncbi:DUF6428 family protein [Daejeonella oryzae]|uniref:DUF6428 family protein n=1 Tax=Daejeonella oryzae TaxID=1122943 RepID=UPI0003FDECDF|nr:DUF6428 family protein [Daejeonella oryzae]